HKNDPQIPLVRGICLADHQRDIEAAESLSRALQIDGIAAQSRKRTLLEISKVEANFNLGIVLSRQGKLTEAIQHYREALRTKDDFDGALNNLAWILASNPDDTLRNGVEAVRLAERACELTQNRVTTYIGTLAAAYAE